MNVEIYISNQVPGRQRVPTTIHHITLENDKTIEAITEPMIGKEMFIYKESRYVMKYGLVSGKKYMSLHVLPIYGSQELHEKYRVLLPKFNFQKESNNFSDESEMPLPNAKNLIMDCLAISIGKVLDDLKVKKKN